MINPVDRLSWQEMLGHPASAGHLVDTQVNTAYNKMAALSDHIDEFKDLYDFVFRIKGWLRYYLQAYYGLKDISESGLNNDTNGVGGDIDLIDPITGDIKTKKVWRIYIKNYDEMIKASENGLPIPTPIVRFANIYDPSKPSYLDLSYDENGNPTFSGTFNAKDPNSFIPLWYFNNLTVSITGDATGTGTVDSNGNVVVPTAVSHAANADHATNADHAINADSATRATNADHAASADKTTGGTVNITGYVSGSGSFDRNGNVTVDVVANIKDTPYTYYVGKTNARDYWGKDENGNQWGSTKDHPFASLGYAINQSNSHIFPGNTINIIVLDAGEYIEGDFRIWHVTCNTIVREVPAEHPRFRGSPRIQLSNSAELYFFSCDFYQWNITSEDQDINGVTFIRVAGDGVLAFCRSCHMIMDSSNFGKHVHPMLQLYGNTAARFDIENAEPALYMELRNGAACSSGIFSFGPTADMEAYLADSVDPANIVINAPAGTKFSGPSVYVERAGNVGAGVSGNYVTGTQRHTFRIDWNIADDSALTQVYLDKYSYLDLPANSVKGQKLPGHAVGTIRDGADYEP